MSYEPDTLEGVVRFCEKEGQGCESVKREMRRKTLLEGRSFWLALGLWSTCFFLLGTWVG